MKVFTRFITSSADASKFPPPSAPEIAFLGRSNVGKSSLINSLVSNKIAKTSNTPGRTQTINFFEVRWPGRPHPDILFADLPGYGYARVPNAIREQWPSFINPYLTTRPTLALCLCLVDANIPPQKSDAQLVDFLKQTQRPMLVVATKADRVGTRLQASLNALRHDLQVDQIVAYSAKTGLGKEDLWKLIREAGERLTGEPPSMPE